MVAPACFIKWAKVWHLGHAQVLLTNLADRLVGPALRKRLRSRKVDKCGTVLGRMAEMAQSQAKLDEAMGMCLGDAGKGQGNPLGHIQRKAPVWIDMLVEQRR